MNCIEIWERRRERESKLTSLSTVITIKQRNIAWMLFQMSRIDGVRARACVCVTPNARRRRGGQWENANASTARFTISLYRLRHYLLRKANFIWCSHPSPTLTHNMQCTISQLLYLLHLFPHFVLLHIILWLLLRLLLIGTGQWSTGHEIKTISIKCKNRKIHFLNCTRFTRTIFRNEYSRKCPTVAIWCASRHSGKCVLLFGMNIGLSPIHVREMWCWNATFCPSPYSQSNRCDIAEGCWCSCAPCLSLSLSLSLSLFTLSHNVVQRACLLLCGSLATDAAMSRHYKNKTPDFVHFNPDSHQQQQ